MPQPLSPKRFMLEQLYPGNLDRDVARMVIARTSWRVIAAAVSERTGVTVSHESMRAWYGNDRAA